MNKWINIVAQKFTSLLSFDFWLYFGALVLTCHMIANSGHKSGAISIVSGNTGLNITSSNHRVDLKRSCFQSGSLVLQSQCFYNSSVHQEVSSLYTVRAQPVFLQDNSCMHVMTTSLGPFMTQKLNRCNAMRDRNQDSFPSRVMEEQAYFWLKRLYEVALYIALHCMIFPEHLNFVDQLTLQAGWGSKS